MAFTFESRTECCTSIGLFITPATLELGLVASIEDRSLPSKADHVAVSTHPDRRSDSAAHRAVCRCGGVGDLAVGAFVVVVVDDAGLLGVGVAAAAEGSTR